MTLKTSVNCIDLTYDIREVAPDLLRDGNPIPASSSQAKKITDRVRDRLSPWIEGVVLPVLQSAFQRDGLQATLKLLQMACVKIRSNLVSGHHKHQLIQTRYADCFNASAIHILRDVVPTL